MSIKKEVLGYLLGFLLFVIGIPALMWWVSGKAFPSYPPVLWGIISGILMVAGLTWSIWSIVYMKKVGRGNPFDAYNHEIAPRTQHLMTDGPYKITRNPMLIGIYIYDIGVLLWLLSWWPLLIFVIEIGLLTWQVGMEEKRLEKDFGEAYRNYKKQTPRYLLMR